MRRLRILNLVLSGAFILSSCSLLGLDQRKNDNMPVNLALLAAVALDSQNSACPGNPPVGQELDGPLRGVRIRWQPLRETAVNRAGGGYRVCSSRIPCFQMEQANCVLLPFRSGASAPTSLRLELKPGLHYIRVYGYSDLNALGEASAEIKVELP